MPPGIGKPSKDPYPIAGGFSYRDYETGWIFPEVRAYAWRWFAGSEPGANVKHAHDRSVMWDVPKKHQINPASECGVWASGPGSWLGVNGDLGVYIQLPRCMDCLKAIGAPLDHPYRWAIRPVVQRKKKAPVKVNKEFNSDPAHHGRPAALTPRQRRIAKQK